MGQVDLNQPLVLDGESLTLAQVERAALGAPLTLSPKVLSALKRSRQVVEDLINRGDTAYGINTGFGRLANVKISSENLRNLQRNLILSHSSGVGDYVSDGVVRAMIALRVNALAKGFSGCRPELLQALINMANAGILPRVPSHGSVGASGDLAPLSHIALGLLGEGEVSYQGRIMEAAQAMAAADIEPFQLAAKEGLALINGTQFMNAVGSLAMIRAGRLLKMADIVGAMTVEAMLGTVANLHPMVGKLRPHLGQAQAARNVRRITEGSSLVLSHKNCDKVQDPYSLRCLPQVHGAAREGWRFASEVLEREMNSVTDNPLVIPQEFLEEAEKAEHPHGMILSAGNFHGAPLAMALDTACIAMCPIGTISERRCDKLVCGTDHLTAFLASAPGVESGYMIVQYAAASLVNENKVFAHPASVDTVPTSGGQEDHNSHGPTAAHKLAKIVDNLENILACELVCATQALEERRPISFGPGTEAAFRAVRKVIAPLEFDRPPYRDIEAARLLINSGTILNEVEAAVGVLE
ncbi:MAG: histidine ammonia-lyase [Candidatus Bruticola sp.]